MNLILRFLVWAVSIFLAVIGLGLLLFTVSPMAVFNGPHVTTIERATFFVMGLGISLFAAVLTYKWGIVREKE